MRRERVPGPRPHRQRLAVAMMAETPYWDHHSTSAPHLTSDLERGSTATPDVSHPAPSPGDTCPICDDLTRRARDARVVRIHAESDVIATQRALEDHEHAAHPWQKPRAWFDATGATYTYRIEGQQS